MDKYVENKTKYSWVKNQTGGRKKMNIVVLHTPTIWNEPTVPLDLKPIINKLKKYSNVHNYFFKFSYYGNKFNLGDIEFDNATKDIYEKFNNLEKFVIIALEHAVPYGLYFADRYPKKCQAIISYPYRFYNFTSYERRIWKMKNNKGFEKIIKNIMLMTI